MALLAPFLCFTWLLKGIGVIHTLCRVACAGRRLRDALPPGAVLWFLVRKAAWQGLGNDHPDGRQPVRRGGIVGVVPNVERINMETWLGGGICFGIAILYLAVIASATAAASLTPTYPAYNQSARTKVAQSQQSSQQPGRAGFRRS
ncbi:MAG: hypothetical protein Ct9H300mP1_13870 [Planctomycetaceae bacterium]|nr:MAG: hypothetical protein Ct9H300mP1_13870 [Planctomycetaceae bacterium]